MHLSQHHQKEFSRWRNDCIVSLANLYRVKKYNDILASFCKVFGFFMTISARHAYSLVRRKYLIQLRHQHFSSYQSLLQVFHQWEGQLIDSLWFLVIAFAISLRSSFSAWGATIRQRWPKPEVRKGQWSSLIVFSYQTLSWFSSQDKVELSFQKEQSFCELQEFDINFINL